MLPYPVLTPVFLVLAAAPLTREGVAFHHAPETGSSRTVAFELELTLEGGELEVTMDGNEVPSMYLPKLNLDMTDRQVVGITETFDEGAWLRRYDELTWVNDGTMSMDMNGQTQEFPWSSEGETAFADRTVRFALEDGELARAFADEQGGETSLLDGLRADLGLAELLPEDPVEVGDTWTVDGAELEILFNPGGELHWELPAEMAEHMLPEIESREHSGELELTLVKLGEDGEHAHCSVTGTLVRVTTQPGDLSEVPVTDGDATDTVTETWEVEGDLVWNLAAGQVASLELDGSFAQMTLTERDPDQPGSTYESTFTIDGEFRVTVEAEPQSGRAIEASAGR